MSKKIRRMSAKCAAVAVLGGILSVGSMILPAEEAQATVVVKLSESELAAASDVVVYGELVASEGEMQANGRVMTRHELRVKQWLKRGGAESSETTLVFYTRGGTAGDFRTRVSGEAPLEPGDEVVVYLEALNKDGALRFYPLGLAQGAYVVLWDGAHKRVVRSDERTARRVLRSRAANASVLDEADSSDRLLEDFLKKVQRDVEAATGTLEEKSIEGDK